MDAAILAMLGLMGSWNVVVMFWVLKTVRAHNNRKHNPHPPPCEEHGKTLERLEQVVLVLWNEAHPGQPMPKM